MQRILCTSKTGGVDALAQARILVNVLHQAGSLPGDLQGSKNQARFTIQFFGKQEIELIEQNVTSFFIIEARPIVQPRTPEHLLA